MDYNIDLLLVLEHYKLLESNVSIDYDIKIPCPFHGEHNPSLSINIEKGTYFCFGCGISGNAIKMVAQIEGVNELKAMQLIKRMKTGDFNDNELEGMMKERFDKEKLTSEELLFHAQLYYDSLPQIKWRFYTKENKLALKYLKKRGYSKETLVNFGVKLNPNDIYPVLIPIYEQQEFKGSICRRIDGNDDERKYLYSEGFKRKLTYMGTVVEAPVLITEGSLDLMKAWQYGAKNSVAILGWKITPYQIEKLKEYTDVVISALDNTPTGREGTRILRKHFKKVIRFKFPPLAKDIGDLSEYQWKRAWFETQLKLKKILEKRLV